MVAPESSGAASAGRSTGGQTKDMAPCSRKCSNKCLKAQQMPQSNHGKHVLPSSTCQSHITMQ
eukprot:4422368-Amphidinium_carterae.2